MPMVIAGLLLLWLSSVLLRGFVRANPAALARLTRTGGGTVALVMAVLLILRGEFNLALLAAGAGLWLLQGRPRRTAGSFAFGAARQRHAEPNWGQGAGARFSSVDVFIDPVSGRISGRFRAGPHAGAALDGLSPAQVMTGYRWCLAADPVGADLLEPYLDSRFPGWRDADHVAGDAGSAKAGRRAAGPTRMTDHEAYDVLGLAEGASREEIARAHRRLMKKHHPDHGGSTDMAARINQAKDALISRHP
jgi:hypothetical protein